jgi:hypothetical protein
MKSSDIAYRMSNSLQLIQLLWDSGRDTNVIQEFIEEYNAKCEIEQMLITEESDDLFVARQIANYGLYGEF